MQSTGQEKIWNILMAGVGGQGIILASDVLAAAALAAGFDAKKSEIHGMSQRGGSVTSHVRFGRTVHSPVIEEGCADVLLSLELMETLRWLPFTHAGTGLIVSTEKILPANVAEYPAGIEEEIRTLAPRARFLDPAALAEKIGDKKYVNVALCGVLADILELPETAWRRAIDAHVPGGTADANWRAFCIGRDLSSSCPGPGVSSR
ncbi:MAG: indolepyruvate oxidoreductase subunit beta [Spirochaetales bacterium]|nr:indolepyruvate oxidoreductase subunit beta [Spirochaetales bacterium]